MAVPSYTEDLTDITLSESVTGWVALGGGASGLGVGADLSFQGLLAVDKAVSASEKGQIFNNGASIVNDVGRHFYIWIALGTPGLANTLANRGLAAVMGSATGAYTTFALEGSDTYGASGRIARCYPIRYDNTAGTNRTLTGAPAVNPVVFGATANITATAKGANLAVDAIRHGTGAYLTAGELLSAGDATDNPCTFTGFQVQNDLIANRWGILSEIGSSYELQGIFAIGRNLSGVATLCRFRDSNRFIIIPNHLHTNADFSQIIIDHASTRVEWTNINIESLGTINKGLINVVNASTIFIVNSGIFTALNTTVLRAACTVTNATWRTCGLISLNGASLTSCIIDKSSSTSSVLAATLANINGCSFISDGSNHAVELTSIGAGSMTWNNSLSGYTVGASGSPAPLTALGNEAIFVNVASGTLTINVSDTATVPSIRSAGAVVNVVAGLKTFTFTLNPSITGYEWRIYSVTARGSLAGSVEIVGQESATQNNQSYSYSYSADIQIAVQIIALDGDYEESIGYYTLQNGNQNVIINLRKDLNN